MQSGHAAVTHTVARMFNAPLESAHVKHLSEPTWVTIFFFSFSRKFLPVHEQIKVYHGLNFLQG